MNFRKREIYKEPEEVTQILIAVKR